MSTFSINADTIRNSGGALHFNTLEYIAFMRRVLLDHRDGVYFVLLKELNRDIINDLEKYGITCAVYKNTLKEMSAIFKTKEDRKIVKAKYLNMLSDKANDDETNQESNDGASGGGDGKKKNRRLTTGELLIKNNSESDDDEEEEEEDSNTSDDDDELSTRVKRNALSQQKDKYNVYFIDNPNYSMTKKDCSTVVVDLFRFSFVEGKKYKSTKGTEQLMQDPELLCENISSNIFSETVLINKANKTKLLIIAPSWYKPIISLYMDYYSEKLNVPIKSNRLLNILNKYTLLNNNELDWLHLYLFSHMIKCHPVTSIITTLMTGIKHSSKTTTKRLMKYIKGLDNSYILNYYLKESSTVPPTVEDLAPNITYRTDISNTVLREAENLLSSQAIVTFE